MPRQENIRSRLLANSVVATELILELVAMNPHIRPWRFSEKLALIILAIEGQPAAFAKTVKK
jgi:hypothetical protein